VFHKFLQNQPKPPEPEQPEPPKPRKGAVPSGKYRKRFSEKEDEFGRRKPEFVHPKYKTRSGKKHYKTRRKARNDWDKQYRSHGHGKAYVARYNASLRRKWIQNRHVAWTYARKHGIDPDYWYQITFDQWVVLWTTAESVYHPEKGLVPAFAVQGPPTKKHTAYTDRLDRRKPFTADNVFVFWHGKPVKSKLPEHEITGTQDTPLT
jgi:hypothetical protein